MGFSGSPIVAVNIKDLNPVTLVPGTTVGVSPQMWQAWPCVTGEQYPPNFTSSAAYSRVAGQNAINLNSANQASAAQWAYITRYSPYGSSYYLQVRFLFYVPTVTKTTPRQLQVGFGPKGSPYGVVLASDVDGAGQPTGRFGMWAAAGPLPGGWQIASGGIDVTDYAGWATVELLYTDTMIRVTMNGNASLRLTAAPIPAAADPGLFTYAWNGPGMAGGNGISQLFMNYISQVPA